MKMQWILVAVVLAAVVFGFTYLKLNSGLSSTDQGGQPPIDPAAEVKLYFPQTTSRERDQGPVGAEWETRVPGHYDFWFDNNNDQPIRVGLEQKSCKCTKVEVALATTAWRNWNAAVTLNLVLRARGRVDALIADYIGRAAWQLPEPALAWDTLPEAISGFEVPSRASGWVRLNWKTDSLGTHVLTVRLWMHPQDGTTPPLAELAVPVVIVTPAAIDQREREVGTFSVERPSTKPVMFNCWSSTRRSFTIKPAEETDPFLAIGQPVPLTVDERKALEEAFKNGKAVLGAYRIPVTVRERLDNGRQLDLGPFKLQGFLRVEGIEEPLEIRVTGLVQGEVAINSPEGPDRIQMGNKGYFDAAYGDVKEASLQTRNLDLSFSLDKVPSFLRVELKEPKIVGGVKSWGIRVEVPKRAIAGEFPRDDNPEYRDSAIYLKITDAKNPSQAERRIRIPVSGKASSR